MSEAPPNPWIHVGECPVCVDGIVRVRVCIDERCGKHFYALCDECEAIWLEPDTSTIKQFPDAENPVCPICSAPIYGEHSRWALPQDIAGTHWEAQAIFDVPESETLPPSDGSDNDPESGADCIAATANPEAEPDIESRKAKSSVTDSPETEFNKPGDSETRIARKLDRTTTDRATTGGSDDENDGRRAAGC